MEGSRESKSKEASRDSATIAESATIAGIRPEGGSVDRASNAFFSPSPSSLFPSPNVSITSTTSNTSVGNLYTTSPTPPTPPTTPTALYTPFATVSHTLHNLKSYVVDFSKSVYGGIGGTGGIKEGFVDLSPLQSYQKAAVLIQFARDGEDLGMHHMPKTQRELVLFKIRVALQNVFMVVSFLLALVRFFERPIWTYTTDDWKNHAVYPVSGVPLWPAETTSMIKIPLFIVLVIGLMLGTHYIHYTHYTHYTQYTHYTTLSPLYPLYPLYPPIPTIDLNLTTPLQSSDSKGLKNKTPFHYLLLIHASLSIVLLIVTIAVPSDNTATKNVILWTSLLSVGYIIWFNIRVRQKLQTVCRTMPHFALLIGVFAVFVVVFASFGTNLINTGGNNDDDYATRDAIEDDYYFSNFRQSVWSVFVAITSSNWPNQIIPAYRNNRSVCVYFITFIIIGSYIILNVIVVIVLVRFQRFSDRQDDYKESFQKLQLLRAFEWLDTSTNDDGKEYMSI